MSKHISIPGFIVADPAESWERNAPNVLDGMSFAFQPFTPASRILICEHTLTFEIPEGFDPRPQQVKALQEKERKLRAEFSKAVMEINAQIQSLQALSFEAVEVQE